MCASVLKLSDYVCAGDEKDYLGMTFTSITKNLEGQMFLKKASRKQQPTETSTVMYFFLKDVKTGTEMKNILQHIGVLVIKDELLRSVC